jgi:antitoxin Phd
MLGQAGHARPGGKALTWRVAEAKNRPSEVVNRALTAGPQVILLRRDAVVVIARRDYEKLTGKRSGFKRFLLGKDPSLRGVDLTRDKSPARDVRL